MRKIILLSEVGFEPTPTIVDQNALLSGVKECLESGALDRSATLTLLKERRKNVCQIFKELLNCYTCETRFDKSWSLGFL